MTCFRSWSTHKACNMRVHWRQGRQLRLFGVKTYRFWRKKDFTMVAEDMSEMSVLKHLVRWIFPMIFRWNLQFVGDFFNLEVGLWTLGGFKNVCFLAAWSKPTFSLADTTENIYMLHLQGARGMTLQLPNNKIRIQSIFFTLDVLLVLNVGNGWEWGLLGLLWIIPSFPTKHR